MSIYYCETCGKFRTRNEVKKIKEWTHIAIFIHYECKYCHNPVDEQLTKRDIIRKVREGL